MTTVAQLHFPRATVPAAHAEPGFTVTPLQPSLGGLVHGLDLSAPVSQVTEHALRRALLDYGVLVLEADAIDDDRFSRFASLFGTPFEHNHYNHKVSAGGGEGPADPVRIGVVEAKEGHVPRNDVWHIDGAYTRQPPDITALYGSRLPAVGGDTMWLNTTVAFEQLPPTLQAYLESLVIVNSFESTGQTSWPYRSPEIQADMRVKYPPLAIPLVRRHPLTGRKQLYATESATGYIQGLSRVASLNLLAFIFELQRQPELELRVQWRPGTVAVWDNRIVHHRANNDYDPAQRSMHRIMLRSWAD